MEKTVRRAVPNFFLTLFPKTAGMAPFMYFLRVSLVLLLVSPWAVREGAAQPQRNKAAQRLSEPIVQVGVVQTSSLYNRGNARTVGSSSTSWFGPKSGGIRYDARMIKAAQIAEERARKKSTKRCWRSVKVALKDAQVIQSYPQTAYAKQAGGELTAYHGFRQLPGISDPYKAPVGSVLVYGGKGAGHVEFRTRDGFVSDFKSPTPSSRPLLGVYVKPN